MHKDQAPVYYKDYLQLDKLLECQELKSKEFGAEAHDETLFIVIHQVYELWFKQILHELNSVIDLFSSDYIREKNVNIAVSRINRIIEIQRILNGQLTIMETMTPLDFLDFRDYLIPASGFQSIQFREIEILLGLKLEDRLKFAQYSFYNRLEKKDRDYLSALEKDPCLLELVDKWLSRMPFSQSKQYDFWKDYEVSIDKMITSDEDVINRNPHFNEKERSFQLKNLEATRETFEALLDEKQYNKLKQTGHKKFSHKAALNAVFIHLYRNEPMLNSPFSLMSSLMDLDENFTAWRYRHALMAHRLLGTKIGTGGSSGHEYLKSTAENNRVFKDLFDISTYLLPRNLRPELPERVKSQLRFNYSE